MIDRIDHIVMNCRDVEATASWYERALGFEREVYQGPAEPGQRIALKFGRQKLNLRPTGSPGWVTCKVDVPGSLDLCFITEGSLKPIIERWKSCGIPHYGGPRTAHRRSRAHDLNLLRRSRRQPRRDRHLLGRPLMIGCSAVPSCFYS